MDLNIKYIILSLILLICAIILIYTYSQKTKDMYGQDPSIRASSGGIAGPNPGMPDKKCNACA